VLVLSGCGELASELQGGGTIGRVDAGPGVDAGSSSDGGVQGQGTFCAPCIENADCGGDGALCVGQAGHCGLDCSLGQACPAGSSCEIISRGKAPALHQCVPTVAACGDLNTRPALDCSDGWSGYADGFFADTCRTCHTGAFATASEVQQGAEGIRFAIDTGSMPRGEPLDAGARLRILTWLGCGSASPPASVR
jgi:hypothetical protein